MAASRSLGTLTIDLLAKTGGFRAGMTAAERQADKSAKAIARRQKQLAADLDRIYKGVGLAAAAVFATLAVSVKKSVDDMLQLGIAAKQVGMPVEQFTAFAGAAKRADVSVQDFTTSMRAADKALLMAQQGSKQQLSAFAALGIDPAKVKDNKDLILKAADALSKYRDGVNKTAIEQVIFGRGGAALNAYFDQGAAGIQKMADRMGELGITFGPDAQQKLAQYDNVQKDFADTITGLRNKIAIALLPSLTSATEWLAKMVGGMDKDAVSGFTAVVNTLARSGILVAGAFASAGSAMGAFMAASHELLSNNGKFIQDGKMFTPDELVKYTQARLDGKSTEGIGSPVDAAGAQVAKADAILSEFWADQKKHWAGILDDVATFGDETAKAMEKAMPKGDNRPDLPFTPTAPGTKGKGAKPHDLTQGLRDQLLQLSLTDKQFQLYRLAVQGAGADQIDLAGGMIDTIAQLKAQQDATAELARVLEDAKTPAQQFGDAMQRIADARDVALATQSGAQLQFTLSQLDELAKRTNAVFLESQAGMDAMTEFARQAAHNIQDAFAQFLFDPFHDGVKGMLRSFAEMLQKMAAQAAASQLLQSLGNSMSGSSTGWVAALGHALAGARAAGGPVSGGGTYLVGEKGPELFTPSSSGHITPNDQIASVTRSGGITVQSSVTVNAGGRDSGDPTQDAVMARQLNEMVKRSAKDVILRALQPGGIIWNQQHRVSA